MDSLSMKFLAFAAALLCVHSLNAAALRDIPFKKMDGTDASLKDYAGRSFLWSMWLQNAASPNSIRRWRLFMKNTARRVL